MTIDVLVSPSDRISRAAARSSLLQTGHVRRDCGLRPFSARSDVSEATGRGTEAVAIHRASRRRT